MHWLKQFSKSLENEKQQIWRKVLRNQNFYSKFILFFYKYWKTWSKTPSRSAWLSAYSSGKKGKQKGKFRFAISFPLVVRGDPSSATLHSKMMGVPRLHPMRSNNAHKATSGTSASQKARWQSLRGELRAFLTCHNSVWPSWYLSWLGGCHSGSGSSTAAHLSWLSLITIALATPLKCKFTQ